MFVDNIIMHHKRIHDKNREIAVSNAKAIALGKYKAKEGRPKTSMSPRHREINKWRDKFDSKQDILVVRGRIATRRMRARSRWVSVVNEKTGQVMTVEKFS
jgi:hypothetical protein